MTKFKSVGRCHSINKENPFVYSELRSSGSRTSFFGAIPIAGILHVRSCCSVRLLFVAMFATQHTRAGLGNSLPFVAPERVWEIHFRKD